MATVESFGAKGNSNGTAGNGDDDTSPIQEAFDELQLTGEPIEFGNAIYRTTAPIIGDAINGIYNLKGRRYCSRIFLDASENVSALSFNPADECPVSIIPRVIIAGLNFVAPTTASSDQNRILSIANNQGFIFKDCFSTGYYVGMAIEKSYGVRIVRSNFTGIKSAAIYSTDDSFNSGEISDSWFFLNGLITSDSAVVIHSSNGALSIRGNGSVGNYGAFLFTNGNDGVDFRSNYMEYQTWFDFFLSGLNRGWTIGSNRIGSPRTTPWALSGSIILPNNIAGGAAITCPGVGAGNMIVPQNVEIGSSFTTS